MTEISSPIVSQPNPTARGTCGKVRSGVDVRLVDEHDCEVAIGNVGEMLVRTDRPWAMSHGYLKDPVATARAWRNGWFHTEDAFRQDAAGNFFFVDRMKDSIRRRGENISSFEVEAEVVGICGRARVRSARGTVRIWERRRSHDCRSAGAGLQGRSGGADPFSGGRGLPISWCRAYVRTLTDLPKTPTAKVLKAQLRSEGVTPDTWDREKAGIVIRRDRL